MLSGATSLMMMVSHSSSKCCRCAFTSSLGKPQNWLAYTIVIRPVLSSKFLVPMLTAGPTGTLATAGTEYLWSDLLVIAKVEDGARVTGSFVGGVAEEEAVQYRLFLRSASRFFM